MSTHYLNGEESIPPDPTLGHAANFLYMLHGERPTEMESRAMDVAMLLMADHGFNASTFAARVTSSTLADLLRRHHHGDRHPERSAARRG